MDSLARYGGADVSDALPNQYRTRIFQLELHLFHMQEGEDAHLIREHGGMKATIIGEIGVDPAVEAPDMVTMTDKAPNRQIKRGEIRSCNRGSTAIGQFEPRYASG